MRLVALILSLVVFVLSSAPSCAFEGESGKECTTEKNCTDNQSHDEDDCNDNCSPFYSCGTCSGFTFCTSFYFIKPVIQPQSHIQIIPYDRPFTCAYYGKVWQPPKIA